MCPATHVRLSSASSHIQSQYLGKEVEIVGYRFGGGGRAGDKADVGKLAAWAIFMVTNFPRGPFSTTSIFCVPSFPS